MQLMGMRKMLPLADIMCNFTLYGDVFMMPSPAGNSLFPAASSSININPIAHSDTSPDVSVWEKIKAFFCSTKKPEVLELIRQICHPPAGTTLEQVAGRFEQLRTFAFSGFAENVQFGRHEENHFCILDENSREMLTVILDDAGKYTVKYEGGNKIYNLTMDDEETCRQLAEASRIHNQGLIAEQASQRFGIRNDIQMRRSIEEVSRLAHPYVPFEVLGDAMNPQRLAIETIEAIELSIQQHGIMSYRGQ
ncbi:hypothetical protein [Enterobacter sp. 22466]|uniref:hypothetical protein n=1 Tax=Enterobacter sp. 22466 TaxID=3453924 RepID=UPI003F83A6F2